jgi:hypothetical protein
MCAPNRAFASSALHMIMRAVQFMTLNQSHIANGAAHP